MFDTFESISRPEILKYGYLERHQDEHTGLFEIELCLDCDLLTGWVFVDGRRSLLRAPSVAKLRKCGFDVSALEALGLKGRDEVKLQHLIEVDETGYLMEVYEKANELLDLHTESMKVCDSLRKLSVKVPAWFKRIRPSKKLGA